MTEPIGRKRWAIAEGYAKRRTEATTTVAIAASGSGAGQHGKPQVRPSAGVEAGSAEVASATTRP